MAFDLCSMYMAQIGENVKNLTDGSQAALSEVIHTDILRYFRNRIDHDYEKVNKPLLQTYIQQMTAPKTMQLIQEQYKACITSGKK